MVSIELPRMVGTREAATRLLEQLNVPEDLVNESVDVVGRNLSTSTASFTDELLIQLEKRGVREIVIVAAPDRFKKQVGESVELQGLKNVRVASVEELSRL